MIKTLAVKITEETYPIAIACLPAGFATIKKKYVLGHYLVINDLQFPDYSPAGRVVETPDCDPDDDVPPARISYNQLSHRRGPRARWDDLTLTNFWSPKKIFKKDFKKVDKDADTSSFFEITRK